MTRYGGDYGRYWRGMRGYPAGMGREYGFDYGYGVGPEDFRGGFYRGLGARGIYGRPYGGMRFDAYSPDRLEYAGDEGWFGTGYEGDLGVESQFGYGRGGEGWGRASAVETGYGIDYRPGWGGYGRFGGVGFRERVRSRLRGAELVCAADIMTENPEAVTADTSVADAARKMKELNVGVIPVVDDLKNRHLKGVITDRDIAVRVVADGKDGSVKIADYMTKNIESCRKDDTIRDVLDVMRSEQVRRVPITDEEGALVGIIAQADLAVDYAGLDRNREIDVEETIERISEPARPERGPGRIRSRNR